jgi:transcriptional regulator with XRE-family HTH domain
MNSYVFGENLKFLRDKHRLKQSDMLPLLGFSQTTWNNYERGVSLPKMSDLEKISDHFRILESDLLHTELTYHTRMDDVTNRYAACKTPENHVVQEQPQTLIAKRAGHHVPVPPRTHSGTPMVITVDGQGRDNIVYVPIKAQAGYLLGYSDKEYIENLPSFHMPGLNNGTYRMFEVQGVSMAPTLLDKDRVIAQWVSSAEDIRDNRVHVIVHKEGVAIKRVLNRVAERNKIYLKSDTLTYRTEYPIKEIDPADVLEIWYVRLKISADLSEPSEVYNRLSNLEINQHEIMRSLGLKE